jgi:tyrosine-protein kinase Etk/Wzc
MNPNTKNTEANEKNLFEILSFKFLPYWPFLIIAIVLCFAGAFAYLKIALPTYEATATLLVKDEKKGSDDSRMMEDLNVFGSKKIVENEIEVMRSRSLLKEVVRTLLLYAPVSMQSDIRAVSAYTTTPVIVEVREPDKILKAETENKIYFSYDGKNKLVKLDNNTYPIDKWIPSPYGELRFTANPKFKQSTDNPLFFSLFPPKAVVVELAKKLNVSAPNKLSSIVNLQFIDESPERAEDILNELISAYNRAGINDKNTLANNTMQFIEERLKHVQLEIDSIEKQIQLYRSEKGAVNLSEQSSLFLKNVGDNDQRAALINMQLSVLDKVESFVNSGKSKGSIVPSTLGIDDPILSQMLTRLSNTELEYEKLKNTTAENNPLLISLSDELKQLRPSIMEGIRIQKINLTTSINQINETNRKYSKVLQTIPEKERKLLEISRQQKITNDVYDFLLQKKEETALSYASTLPDSRILDVAESSIKPVSPKKIFAFPIALVAAFLITFALIYLKDFASNKILFRGEIETLTGSSVVGEIAFLKKNLKEEAKDAFMKQQLFEIIASIGLFGQTNSIKKILLTSSISEEGKSFISMNFARSLAEAGKKVVLVDLDFIKSTVSNTFETKKGPGVAEVLKGQIEPYDVIDPTSYTNLYLVRAGELDSNYAALLTNGKIQHLISFLEQSFDFIIIDTSPIDPLADALILTELSDITLYIVRHAITPKTLFQFQYKKMDLLGIPNIGILFNGVKPRGFYKGFGFGYGYQYSYTYNQQPSIKRNSHYEQVKVNS